MSARPALSLQEVMTRLGVSRKTILALIRRGELPAYQVGRQWRLDPPDVDAFVERQKAAAVPPRRPRVTSAPAPRPRTSSGVNWKGADRYTH